jgi:hypothetical protein
MTTDSKSNRYYTANLLFGSLRNDQFSSENMWEESFVLIEAKTSTEAYEKAAELGQSTKLTYQAVDGTKVSWEFVRVGGVFEIDGTILQNGTELFSRHLRGSEVESLSRPFDE